MIGRIVEIADDRRHLSVFRGFLAVKDTESGDELGRIPLDDIAAVIANAHGLSYTNNLLVQLSHRGAPFVVCDQSHNVVSMLWPVEGHHLQAKRFDAQLAAGRPLAKRLWSEVVKSKLSFQAATLEAVGAPSQPLLALVSKVRSGDPQNIEAQGAKRYWRLLFGEQFRRDQNGAGLNGLLNYGYTVLRAATARAIIAAGLHPTLGIHHQNEANAMRLVDDLMEPLRPMMDLRVWKLHQQGQQQVDPETKRTLVHALFQELDMPQGASPLMVCLQRMATSLAQVYLGERKSLELPKPPMPIALVAQ